MNQNAWKDPWVECLERLSKPEPGPIAYDQLLHDSVTLLTSRGFTVRTPDWQIAAICTVFSRMISSMHAQAGAVATLAAPHFTRLLLDPRIQLSQACQMYDALWGMWWCAASSLDDMRPIQEKVCLPFHDFLERRRLVSESARRLAEDTRPIRIAYLMHYAHAEAGNAVAPLVVSLARAHAALPDRKVFAYAVQWVDDTWFKASFEDSSVVFRSCAQGGTYARLDALFDELRADKVDVVVTDTSSSIASVLFARRVAPKQIRLDLGMPYWFQPEIDLVLLSGKRWRDCYPFARARSVEIQMNQDKKYIYRTPDEGKAAQARAALPTGAKILGVFTRLIKITPGYLNFIRRVLLMHPNIHFVVGGTGDPRVVRTFMAAPELAGRITLLHRNVDLAVFARVIDIFVDTFPLIGGLTCREFAAHGVPIFSVRSTEWGLKQDQDRDPLSIAEDEPALLRLIERALRDSEFLRARAAAAASSLNNITDVAVSARDVDAAIVGHRRDTEVG